MNVKLSLNCLGPGIKNEKYALVYTGVRAQVLIIIILHNRKLTDDPILPYRSLFLSDGH